MIRLTYSNLKRREGEKYNEQNYDSYHGQEIEQQEFNDGFTPSLLIEYPHGFVHVI